MTLNASGPISLAGATTGQSIAVELSVGATTQISLNCTNVRTLAGVASGAIVMPTNFWGKSASVPFGCATYGTPGTYSFVVPSGVTKISVVVVGGGGGAQGYDMDETQYHSGGTGGALSYTNCIVTTPGETLTVVVGIGGLVGATGCCADGQVGTNGGDSYVSRGATTLILAKGGLAGNGMRVIRAGGAAACGVGAVRYSGGANSSTGSGGGIGGGGGAAGYAGNGGYGALISSRGAVTAQASAGTGGAGGGGGIVGNNYGKTTNYGASTYAGGGVGLLGTGANGTAGTSSYSPTITGSGGGGGSGGTSVPSLSWTTFPNYGGGSSQNANGSCAVSYNGGGSGGVRIIYGGTGKSYPNNAT